MGWRSIILGFFTLYGERKWGCKEPSELALEFVRLNIFSVGVEIVPAKLVKMLRLVVVGMGAVELE